MRSPKSEKEKEELFREYFAGYYNSIKLYALGILKDNDDAKEVAQNVFMSFWQNMESVDYNNNVVGYLFLSAKWKCLRILDLRKYSTQYKKYGKPDNYIDLAIARNSNLHSIWDSELIDIVNHTLESMPEKTREVFVMNKFNNFSQQEIAQKQNCSVKNVEYRMASAMKILREALKDYLPFILGIFISKF